MIPSPALQACDTKSVAEEGSVLFAALFAASDMLADPTAATLADAELGLPHFLLAWAVRHETTSIRADG